MAGVVAMASVIEDFDKQPCKKSRKDGGSPVVKTITNYFSPVAKPAEKPFSPPRSNNIMDYFSRKTPASKERTSTPEQAKENCKQSISAGKQPSQKRGGKSSQAARKLVAVETVDSIDDESCIIIEDLCESKNLATKVSNSGVHGSDTAALLAEVCATAEISAPKTDDAEQGMEVKHGDNVPKCRSSVERKSSLSVAASSPVAPPRSEVKHVKSSPRNAKKKPQMKTKPLEDVESEKEKAMCDVSMEASPDEESPLNSSTVTISFEDFVRSQSEEKSDEENTKITTSVEGKVDGDQVDTGSAEENVESGEPSVQVSPRTVTIQAEVHVVSPKQESIKTVGKLASIFNQRKKTNSPMQVVSADSAGQQPPCPFVKRKSNVVLQEEDLELAEIESESTPKCSEAEKKQFMAAFKQPSTDGSKTKPVKSQVKQKQLEENAVEAEDNPAVPPAVDKVVETPKESPETPAKPSRRGRNKAKEGKETVTTPDAADKQDEPTVASSVQPVRRSRRETAGRKEPETKQRSVRTASKQNESEGDVAIAEPLDSPVTVSTPKTRKSKRDVFVAEMMSPPDAKGSPIRMKLTRVKRKTEAKLASNESTPSKTSDESEKRKQAKRLVEKAKVIQSKTTSLEEKSTLRRSSRTEASVKRSYCEDEDSIVFIDETTSEDSQKKTEKSKNPKPLRSLNDVLGRAAAAGKEAKAAPGCKATEKAGRKVPAVISIFDDSSRDDSENSQDDEQFKARREFLKSGLPESFRKQIAKTAATKEAYSLSCSSFQPVTHTTQPPNGDCPLWSLPWPESSLLCHLKDVWSRTSGPYPSVSGSLCVKTEAARRNGSKRSSGPRPEISESVRQLLMEELRTSNPQFPAEMFMTRFQKRRSDYQQQQKASETVIGVKSTPPPAEPACGKRKRRNDEQENTAKVAKKLRSNHLENVSAAEAEPPKRGRSRRTRKTEEENVKAAPIPADEDSVVILDDCVVIDAAEKKDEVKEDVLWTDKYQPQLSTDIVDNTASVKRLHSWLKEWKLRADREERKKQKDKKQEEDSSDVEWDCAEEDGEDTLCNTMILTGPTGVGKTAAVYACAQELGFKVFEVNASSQRSGRLILSQLKEATQSHQVDGQGVGAHKPSYFNSYGSSSGSARPGSSPRKNNSPRRAASSPRKPPQSPRGTKRGALAPTSLASYFFKMGQPNNKESTSTAKNQQPAASKKVTKASEGSKKQRNTSAAAAAALVEKHNEEPNKKTATSLILFEEVDVIFDDDFGFLAAIKTFMATTKRPVILTTSDPAFNTMFDGSFEELHFKTPSVPNVGSYLQLLCLAEDMRTEPSDVSALLRLNGCDVRQTLLQLQFWTRSSETRPSVQTGGNELHPENKEESLQSPAVPFTSPQYNASCTESKLGLLNVEPDRHVWELLQQDSSLVDDAACWELLTNSKRRGVDLLYSNMERLLPLPLTRLSASTRKAGESAAEPNDCSAKQEASACLQSTASLLQTAEASDCSDSSSPIKVSHRMRKKRRHCTPDQGGPHSDSEERFLSLNKPSGSDEAKEKVAESSLPESVKRKPPTPEERAKSVPVSQCLRSLAEFFDNMSYMDSCLVSLPGEGDAHRRASPVSVVFKDGMADESRDEADGGGCWTDCSLEIHSAAEALSFQRCRASVTEAWERTQELEAGLRTEAAAELSLPVAAHQQGYSFFQDGPCPPQLVQQRREVMETLAYRGVFASPFNRAAAALDYLPVIRSICRSEQLKEQGKVKRRFLHYLDVIHMALEKSTLQLLAQDFP
ncbi:ATPase family AAA domain-containing protein 5 isoform X3 [Salarias fasciatus]|uniref:ATPase family AAA domain-containing protein 5 isoform X3 n=1 Tax=Salarias fasciatus TaxID=181472 RepID=UPI001176F8C0|nr:ATPase family AAA domain-containing protein 5-like isoform X3 [Salarias fasciatus]